MLEIELMLREIWMAKSLSNTKLATKLVLIIML